MLEHRIIILDENRKSQRKVAWCLLDMTFLVIINLDPKSSLVLVGFSVLSNSWLAQ